MTNTDNSGVSVHMFLPQGTADGIRTVQIPGWTGRIAYGPCNSLDDLANRPEAERMGLHLFVGKAADGGTMVRMRVSSDLKASLRERFWDPDIADLQHVIIITDCDDMLTSAEAHWVGYLLQADLHKNERRYRDADIPGGNSIGEAQRDQAQQFIERVRIVLPLISAQSIPF